MSRGVARLVAHRRGIRRELEIAALGDTRRRRTLRTLVVIHRESRRTIFVSETVDAVNATAQLHALVALADDQRGHAAEAEPADHEIRIRGTRVPPEDPSGPAVVEVEIADRGSGIPDEILERVFEPFFTTKMKGTGLGLATVHRVVEAHGGQLLVKSRPGEGTSVRVMLPGAVS